MDLVFTFDQQIKHLLGVNCGFAEISHQSNQSSVPFICNLSESSTSACHEYLSHSVLKLLEPLFIHFNECLRSDFLGILILKSPSAVLLREFLLNGSDLGKNAHFKPIHIEQQIRVVLGVHSDKAALPFDGGERTRKAILDFPKHGSSQVDIMLHETHAAISRPALLVVIANDVLVVRVRIFS